MEWIAWISVKMGLEAHGTPQWNFGTPTTRGGWQITIGSSDVTLTKITKDPDSTTTTAYLYTDNGSDSPGSEITSASFSGEEATFNDVLSANTKYWVSADKDGSSYTAQQYGPSISFPVSGTTLDWTLGLLDDPHTSAGRNIESINVTVALAAAGNSQMMAANF